MYFRIDSDFRISTVGSRAFPKNSQRILIRSPNFRTPSIKISSFINVISNGCPPACAWCAGFPLESPHGRGRRCAARYLLLSLDLLLCRFGTSVCKGKKNIYISFSIFIYGTVFKSFLQHSRKVYAFRFRHGHHPLRKMHLNLDLLGTI